MIRVVMLGRLGNNLFQYSLGRALSEKHGVPLVMDASWFNALGWSQVECLRLLPGPAAGKARIVRRASPAARALLKVTDRHYWDFRGVPVLREPEPDQSFDPRFLNAPADCMIFGYFQTPLYFAPQAATLRAELSTGGLGLEDDCAALAAALREPGSVAVHVRRGDYTGNPNLDLCGPDYYQRAMTRMSASITNARFFIFSDDPPWCARHLPHRHATVVTSPAAASPLRDLHLMSLASHHIIANSSYSWWAAWLGEKTGQIVLLPDRWFASIRTPIHEKMCAHWITVATRVDPAS